MGVPFDTLIIILLYDKDFGEIEELPFDINHRRITSFTLESCEEKRLCDEKIVFSTASNELYVCDTEGKTLCKGRMEEGGFTGYKSTDAVDILREFSNNSTKPFECDILSDEKFIRT